MIENFVLEDEIAHLLKYRLLEEEEKLFCVKIKINVCSSFVRKLTPQEIVAYLTIAFDICPSLAFTPQEWVLFFKGDLSSWNDRVLFI